MFYALFLFQAVININCISSKLKVNDGFIVSLPEKYVSGNNTDEIAAVKVTEFQFMYSI